MKYSFHPAAKTELIEAIDYYEDCQPELGLEFAKEIYSTIHRIIQYPKAWSPFEKYPKMSHQSISLWNNLSNLDKEILIVAVMQLNRKPSYWKKRTK